MTGNILHKLFAKEPAGAHTDYYGNDGRRLIHISDPIAVKHHDAHAFRETGLADILNLSNTLADKGYQGTGMVTPIKK